MWFQFLAVICLCLSRTITADVRVVRQAPNALGGRCTTPDNKSGTCVNIKSCQSLNELLLTSGQNSQSANFLRQSQCGSASAGSMTVVCCPNPETAVTSRPNNVATTRPTARTVTENTNYDECGKSERKESRIVGGINATLGDWPWMVALGFRSTSKTSADIDFKCGATLISKNWIITAAHCVQNIGNFQLTTARLGDLDLNPNTQDGATPIDAEIAEIIPHPQYTTNPITNDIALLRLKNTVKFSKHIRPICLMSGSEYRSDAFYSRKMPYIIGWGALEWRGAVSTRLQETRINIVNTTDCANIYSTQRTAKIDQRVLCAGEKNKDTCQGDSGGPLIFPIQAGNTNFVYYLGGIVSFGVRCADLTFPGVYTKVAEFTDWISRTTGSEVN